MWVVVAISCQVRMLLMTVATVDVWLPLLGCTTNLFGGIEYLAILQ